MFNVTFHPSMNPHLWRIVNCIWSVYPAWLWTFPCNCWCYWISLHCVNIEFLSLEFQSQNVLALFPDQVIFHFTICFNKRTNCTSQKLYIPAITKVKSRCLVQLYLSYWIFCVLDLSLSYLLHSPSPLYSHFQYPSSGLHKCFSALFQAIISTFP